MLYFQLFLFLYMRGQWKEYHSNFHSIFKKHLEKCKYSALNNRSAITLNNGTLILHKKINILFREYYFSHYSVKHPNICPAITATPTPIDDILIFNSELTGLNTNAKLNITIIQAVSHTKSIMLSDYRNENVSGRQCHLIHLTILRRSSWPSLAYMCTKVV